MALASRPLGSQPLASAEAAAASGRTGTLSATLGALTSSATGTVALTGTLSQTLGAVTTAATGAVALAGTLTQTLGALTLAADGTVTSGRVGTLTATLGALTVSATGTVDIAATLGVTLGNLTLTATATNDSPVTDVPRSYPGPAGRAKRGRKPHRSVVEIDGELIVVTGRDEAEALLERVKAKAQEEAPKAAKRALNKARDVERKTGVLPEVWAEPPRVEPVEVSDALASVIERINAEVARIYERAQRDAEIALLARRQAYEQDEEDAIISLLLH